MDVVADNTLEDGEIAEEDDLLLGYVPLKRPEDYAKEREGEKAELQYSDDNSEASSASDSDSDEQSNSAKKSKIKINHQVYARTTTKTKKYDIWCANDVGLITRSLTSCDVGTLDNARGCESYVYPIRNFNENDSRPGIWTKKYRLKEEDADNKQKYDKSGRNARYNEHKQFDSKKGDTGQRGRRAGKRKHEGRKFKKEIDNMDAPRIIPPLVSTLETSEVELACEIANKLTEPNDEIILNVVQIAGKQKSIDLFEEVKNIEAKGGMLVMDGSKRRTPGGVYLFLVKHDYQITDEQKSGIFLESKKNRREMMKLKQRAKAIKLKAEIDLRREQREKLGNLMTRSEIELHKTQKEQAESETEDCLMNPPPSPVTDAKENSNDGMIDTTAPANPVNRTVNTYDDDFLDIDCPTDFLTDL